ncbi:hypothetical protein FA95DRAFT_1604666 [Auriscalpium vulgare]|uniref:Uncharacterized protein n=1 Tax=Auriscalpium vulgare TaxID=40419 RepID=A0ACB8RZJ7_9AGAM|nr:hypothetical protein FA95DRAFT_1604666 [Auriscalpium vulgare]
MAYCDRCSRYFVHDRALNQHIENSDSHHVCDDCDVDFASWLGLEQHYVQSPRHAYCQRCQRHFGSDAAMLQHMRAAHHYCETHRRVFETFIGLTEHYKQSSEHFYCPICDDHFDNDEAFLSHSEDVHHMCVECRTYFSYDSNLKAHYSQNHHYCAPCRRIFKSASNLTHHLNSSTHQPRNVRCPGRGCGRAFVSMSALTLHFESGTCPSGLTREQLNKAVVRLDRNNVVTNPNRLIAGPQGQSAPASTKSYATARAWNGVAYECFLCNKVFSTLHALNMHLASPRHEDKIYRCPKGDCMQEYSTLSALCQHVENGSCGVRRFRQVQDMMDGLVNGMRSLAF